MLVHAVRFESHRPAIFVGFLERSTAIWTDGNRLSGFHPNVRDVGYLK
jgi:hypothetical protein